MVTDVDAVTVDGNGFAFTGVAPAAEASGPGRARRSILRAGRLALSGLVYRATDGATVQLLVQETGDRAAADVFGVPLRIVPVPVGADTSRGSGWLAVVCLTPTAIRRAETVITDFPFSRAWSWECQRRWGYRTRARWFSRGGSSSTRPTRNPIPITARQHDGQQPGEPAGVLTHENEGCWP